MRELIKFEDVFFRYHDGMDWTLKGIDLSVYEGERLAIVGHNGSGKSTLTKLLNGLLLPNNGTVYVEEYRTDDDEQIWEIRRRVGIVFQNPENQFVGTSVRDDIAFGLENIGLPREEMIERIQKSVEKVKMVDYLDQEPHHLSGGQKQRVAIAGIIALRPLIMILDEATSMLDPKGRKNVLSVVKDLNQTENMTVISVTHDLEEAVDADRIIVMNDGEIVHEGTPAEIFQHGEQLKQYGLDLPFPIQVAEQLASKGIHLSKQPLTHDELVEELWKLKLKV